MAMEEAAKPATFKKKTEKGVPMAIEEAAKPATFKKRRAEGRDNSDRPQKILQLKDRRLNPVNTVCYVQIMGSGMDTQDTSPSILLFFDKQRFIFNAGEGLQRFCTEHKIKLSKIDHIFFSRVCSETAGGLPGLLLTLAGMGDEGMSVNIWGPSDLKYLIDAMGSFISKAAMVHAHSFGPSPGSNGASSPDRRKVIDPIVLINDEVVKLSAILLRPSAYEASELNTENCFSDGTNLDLADARNQSSKPLSAKPGDISVVYVCELPEIKGKFDPKKAIALGLRPGPKYRELQLGISVKSDHQNIEVHPSDVMDPSIPGPIVVIVDCPTLRHFQELVFSRSLEVYYEDMSVNLEEPSKAVNCIIHLSPASVTNNNEYKEWMGRFGAAQHIMAGHEMKNVEVPILKSSARITTRLNYLCPQFFPAPGFWSVPGSRTSSEVSLPNPCKSIPAENLLKFHLRPYSQLGLDRLSVPSLTTSSEVIDELLSEVPEVVDAAKQVSKLWKGNKCITNNFLSMQKGPAIVEESNLPCCLEDISREDMEIVLLGTGSSQPSKYRNVSSIFINLFSKGSILLDCGEGTLGQLKRRFGVEGADDAVRGLRCVWISHIHADHHAGLVRILALRRDLLMGTPHESLLVVGPSPLRIFLDAYQLLEDLDMQFLDCRHTTEASLKTFEANNTLPPSNRGSPTSSDNSTNTNGDVQIPDSCVNNSTVVLIMKKLKEVLAEAGLDALVSFPVEHCDEAFGVSLKAFGVSLKASSRANSVGKVVPGWKIVYSGDSRPCRETIKASDGATVLIHEATFEDGMEREAKDKYHSTTQEAIGVGNKAGVYRIILTHFSQRYPKIPVFNESHMHNTCIAFDLMSVNLADLPVLPKVVPFLRTLFKDDTVVDEEEDVVDDVTVAN